MRRLALDIGDARCGIAISDPSGRVATPLRVVPTEQLLGDGRILANLVDEYEVGEIVVGLPLTLGGEEGPQAQQVRRQADVLARSLPIPFVFHDERLSTAEAERALTAAGADGRARKGAVDMAAATIILQTYLDAIEPTKEAEVE